VTVAPEISFIEPPAADEAQIPEQKQHFQLPTRFGAVPVDEAPLGWEVETRPREVKVTKFQHAYPTIRLPFQEVQRVAFGHSEHFLAENEKHPKLRALFPAGANRLFFGDNLHVMRQLPSESVDLIYIDPPFFSGRTHNVIFGDKNEVRSFSDIWEGGMPGYLVWLNARLFEMKRLLKPTGSIYVHLDWHASHYVKVEMDKIFGVDNFRNEIIWKATNAHNDANRFGSIHQTLLFYTKSDSWTFNTQYQPYDDEYIEKYYRYTDKDGRRFMSADLAGAGPGPARRFGERLLEPPQGRHWAYDQEGVDRLIQQGRIFWTSNGIPRLKKYLDEMPGMPAQTLWSDKGVQYVVSWGPEGIGYPTQKSESLLVRVLEASSNEGDVIADFFCGGGTTPAVAQRLNRRWIACDQSRIAVALTADRVAKVVENRTGALFPVPDFTVEHWGIYEAPRLETYTAAQFREFVVRAFGGRPEGVSPAIHGVRYGVPLYVGEPSRDSRITKEDVARFARTVYEERRANHGVMLAWNFGPDARKAAEILAARENKRIDFVRLSLVRLESDEFREHVVSKHPDYGPLLSFIQPPEVRVAIRRLKPLTYEFDVSESVSLNKDGAIANVQWDFSHKPGKFISTQGYTFLRDKKNRPAGADRAVRVPEDRRGHGRLLGARRPGRRTDGGAGVANRVAPPARLWLKPLIQVKTC
jgi:DNA modification methylase